MGSKMLPFFVNYVYICRERSNLQMLIQERIQLILKANNLSASQFADKIDVKRSNLSHVLSGRNNPSLDFLAKIILHFPNVNASWLITGETREENVQVEKQAATSKRLDNEEQDENHPSHSVEKIVWFYTDGTFKAFLPSKE